MFTIPEPAGSIPENRFDFEHKSKSYSMPKIEFLSADAMKYLEAVNVGTLPDPGFSEFIRTFMTKAEPKVKTAVEGLARDQLVALRDAWYESSRVDTGESSASEDS